MSYNPRRPKMVLADPTHSDYSKYTLRNGTTNAKTLQSFENQPDLTNYVNSQQRMAGFYYQHPMKQMRIPVVYNKAPIGRTMDIDSRIEVKEFRGKKAPVRETLLDMIMRSPELLGKNDFEKRQFKKLIDDKLKELDKRLPLNLPNRQEVMEDLIRRFITKRFANEFIEPDLEANTILEQRNEVRDRLLTDINESLRQIGSSIQTQRETSFIEGQSFDVDDDNLDIQQKEKAMIAYLSGEKIVPESSVGSGLKQLPSTDVVNNINNSAELFSELMRLQQKLKVGHFGSGRQGVPRPPLTTNDIELKKYYANRISYIRNKYSLEILNALKRFEIFTKEVSKSEFNRMIFNNYEEGIANIDLIIQTINENETFMRPSRGEEREEEEEDTDDEPEFEVGAGAGVGAGIPRRFA